MTDKLSGMKRLAEISERINRELCDLVEESDLVLDYRTVDRLVSVSKAMDRANAFVQGELNKAETKRLDEVFSTPKTEADGSAVEAEERRCNRSIARAIRPNFSPEFLARMVKPNAPAEGTPK